MICSFLRNFRPCVKTFFRTEGTQNDSKRISSYDTRTIAIRRKLEIVKIKTIISK